MAWLAFSSGTFCPRFDRMLMPTEPPEREAKKAETDSYRDRPNETLFSQIQNTPERQTRRAVPKRTTRREDASGQ